MADKFLHAHHFVVSFSVPDDSGTDGIASAASFAAVDGLELSLQTEGLREGGYNWGMRQLITGGQTTELNFRRGMTTDDGFWRWIQSCLTGGFPLPYIDGEIDVYGPGASDTDIDVRATWRFYRGLVTGVSAAGLDAKGSGVPIESLRISHEGLERVLS